MISCWAGSWSPGSEAGKDRVALLHAVTDWYRAQLPRLLSHDILSYLYQAYRRELAGAAPAARYRHPGSATPSSGPPPRRRLTAPG
jgi:hypothetical protein